MDVIEHVPDPVGWAREAMRVLKPNGTLFLTTPNYASISLRVIENTALELVARLQNFSRKHIHPTKMTPTRLTDVLRDAGASALHVETIGLGWVLAAYGRKSS
jgi:2-polyprenyl-3-methyl-5-hydroxy-6-metoxy-1,4-benzoquinol methylase